MSRKQIMHLIASNYMGVADKIKRLKKRGRPKTKK